MLMTKYKVQEVAGVMVDDRQVARTWTITRKGWAFLGVH